MKVYLKKNKKKKDKEVIRDEIDISYLNDICNDEKDNKQEEKKKKKDEKDEDIIILDSLFNFTTTDNNDNSSGKSKKKKKKEKKSKDKRKRKKIKTELDDLLKTEDANIENSKLNKRDGVDFYEERYKAPLLLLKNILRDINISHKEQKELIEEMKERMKTGKFQPMAISSMFSNISGLLSTRLGVIKEISSVYNKISELELKRENQNFKNKEATKTNDDLTNELMDKALNELLFYNENNKYDVSVDEYTGSGELTSEAADLTIEDMLNSGEIELSESEKAFKYEKNNVSIQIEYDLETNKWEFIAVDEDGNEISDYPLPDRKAVGKIDINFDNMTAKDRLNNSYNVKYKEDYGF